MHWSNTTATVQGGGGGRSNEMNVVLMHKPRGSKGVWFPIDQGDFIRVTKGKGKRLKLEVRTATDISQDIHLSLVVDGAQVIPSGEENGLVVESVRSVPSCTNGTAATEASLKLSRLARRIAVVVRATTADPVPRTLEARTVEFSAHNNGKERYFPTFCAWLLLTHEVKTVEFKTQHLGPLLVLPPSTAKCWEKIWAK
jgi:hypothetical protein